MVEPENFVHFSCAVVYDMTCCRGSCGKTKRMSYIMLKNSKPHPDIILRTHLLYHIKRILHQSRPSGPHGLSVAQAYVDLDDIFVPVIVHLGNGLGAVRRVLRKRQMR